MRSAIFGWPTSRAVFLNAGPVLRDRRTIGIVAVGPGAGPCTPMGTGPPPATTVNAIQFALSRTLEKKDESRPLQFDRARQPADHRYVPPRISAGRAVCTRATAAPDAASRTDDAAGGTDCTSGGGATGWSARPPATPGATSRTGGGEGSGSPVNDQTSRLARATTTINPTCA
jgi:hypothetical protein